MAEDDTTRPQDDNQDTPEQQQPQADAGVDASLSHPERPQPPAANHRPAGWLPTSNELRLTLVGCVVGLAAFIGGAAGAIIGDAISDDGPHHRFNRDETILIAPSPHHASGGFRDRYFGPGDDPSRGPSESQYYSTP